MVRGVVSLALCLEVERTMNGILCRMCAGASTTRIRETFFFSWFVYVPFLLEVSTRSVAGEAGGQKNENDEGSSRDVECWTIENGGILL